jgi:hypothetical protein
MEVKIEFLNDLENRLFRAIDRTLQPRWCDILVEEFWILDPDEANFTCVVFLVPISNSDVLTAWGYCHCLDIFVRVNFKINLLD